MLLGSTYAEADRKTFFKAQVIFWLLAAIDGHAKNFSLFLDAGGGYRLTPSYDVLSAYPVMGKGVRMLQEKKIKMAMALIGQNHPYRWHELQRRHLELTANKCGLGEAGKAIIDELVTQTPHVVAKVAAALPARFPDQVAEPVLGRLQATADKL
ncbi:MAG: HipA domain-containing protein [Thiobacillaceae bacterium]